MRPFSSTCKNSMSPNPYITVPLILSLLFLHFLGDFIFQSHQMSTNKSKIFGWLFLHVLVYTMVVTFGLSAADFFFDWGMRGKSLLPFWGITFLLHIIIDFWTSRATSALWHKQQWHWFFVVIGVDQFLHYACLICAYDYCTH